MITINASVKDAIERVEFLIEYCKEIPSQKKTIEYDLDETSAEYIKEVLCNNDINNCHFSENCLRVTLQLSVEEIAEKQADRMSCAKYWARRLVKWGNNNDVYKLQIEQYLQKYSYKYAAVIQMMSEVKEVS